jgi:hypothetical protein
MSLYSRTDAALGTQSTYDMGSCNSTSENSFNRLIIKPTNLTVTSSMVDFSGASNTSSFADPSTGLFTQVKNGSNGGCSRNGVLITATSSSALPTTQRIIHAAIGLGGAFSASDRAIRLYVARNYAYAATMKLFNMTQEADHYTAVQAFQTALSRQV